MNKKIISGSAIAVAVAALLVGGATPAAARKHHHASKTVKASASPEKHRCNANGCPTK